MIKISEPWFKDEEDYLVGTLDPTHGIDLKAIKRREFNDFGVVGKWRHPVVWRCFYTGVRLYWIKNATSAQNGVAPNSIPWSLSKEHLVPVRAYQTYGELAARGNLLLNQVATGLKINRMMGFRPLAVKLHMRKAFLSMGLGDEKPTLDLYYRVFRKGIEATQFLRDSRNRFIWNLDKTFDAEMSKFDREFLRLDLKDRISFCDEFVWRW